MLRRPNVGYEDVRRLHDWPPLRRDIAEQVEIQTKYELYIQRQHEQVLAAERSEDVPIPDGYEYAPLRALSNEGRDKLSRVRPVSLGRPPASPASPPPTSPSSASTSPRPSKAGGLTRARISCNIETLYPRMNTEQFCKTRKRGPFPF